MKWSNSSTSYNSILKNSFIWPEFKCQKALFDPQIKRYYHSGSEWIWEQWQWRSTPHSHKLQHSLNPGHSLGGGGVLPPSRDGASVFYIFSKGLYGCKHPCPAFSTRVTVFISHNDNRYTSSDELSTQIVVYVNNEENEKI